MPTITPCLWFDDQAEDAAKLYESVFPDARIVSTSRYGEGMPKPAGTAMTVEIELGGLTFVLLNGGPQYTFSEAISFQIPCRDQAEVDHYWDALADGGEPGVCGWLKDRFGVSWQVVPNRLMELLGDPDRERAQRTTEAMMAMTKLDVAALERAADGA